MESDLGMFSVDQIEEARKLLLSNSRELLEESDTLITTNRRFARAYALAHLACEELARKYQCWLGQAQKVAIGVSVNWKELNRRLRDHMSKLRSVALIDYFLGPYTEKDTDLSRLEEELERIPAYNDLKNQSLYVSEDRGTGHFQKPSSMITEDLAQRVRKLAWQRYYFFERAEEIAIGALKQLASDPTRLQQTRKKCKKAMDKLHAGVPTVVQQARKEYKTLMEMMGLRDPKRPKA